VQFVSKPIAPPYADGTKCLVRDLATHLARYEAHVMSVPDATLPGVVCHPVYRGSGAYAPSLTQNARAALWLASRRPAAALWHFVFAPNPRTGTIARALRRLRRVPTLQTVASPPRDFERPSRLIFGDIVVAQSHWTARSLREAFEREGVSPPAIEVIPPPAPVIAPPSDHALAAVRARLGVDAGAPLFVFPGDLEIGGGAEFVLGLAEGLAERVPGARVVVAYRDKTPAARELAARLSAGAANAVRFEPNVADIHALLGAATAVLFPVSDLYGKVDLPIVLLEAFGLGTPVVALAAGPLLDLVGATLLPREPSNWLELLSRLAVDRELWAARSAQGREAAAALSPASTAASYERLYDGLLRRAD
jgi:phosphatidylinositol alpha-1,6-mannosyltransferase